ncbi:hypothetical protein M0R45_005641 [Rubus argutus]|uniref:Dolichol kinase n=1 Tax=Rubus argutus TaxID=59490 RepID=A0AAW1YNM5_RUBAR
MATAAVASWLNGERTVVALFVARVLFSLPSSLLPHGLALSLLAISALFLDILADSSTSLSQFNTRRGASSGILLGAVTLPTVMISKMIQLSRAFSLNEVAYEDFDSSFFLFSMWILVTFSVRWCVVQPLGTSSLTSFETALKLLWNFFHLVLPLGKHV